MPTVGVELEKLARDSEGMSPADLKAMCQEAALAAMARTSAGETNGQSAPPAITHADFNEAMARLQASKEAQNTDSFTA